MKFIFRADASPGVGTGHVLRSCAIAEELIARGEEVVLVSEIVSLPWVEEYTRSVGFSTIVEPARLPDFKDSQNILILDSYNIPKNDYHIKRISWRKVIVIADRLTPRYDYDLLIHPGLDCDWIYEPDNNKVLAGADFIPFRKSIRVRSFPPNQTLNIVVVGGGADIFNFSETIAKLLTKFDTQFHANIISNNSNVIGFDNRFSFFKPGIILDSIANESDLAITTASTSSLEFIARGIPMGVVCAVPNQIEYYKELTLRGMAAPLGNHLGSSFEFDEIILSKLIDGSELRESLIKNSARRIDLLGSLRIVDRI